MYGTTTGEEEESDDGEGDVGAVAATITRLQLRPRAYELRGLLLLQGLL